jgi:alpha-glucosidase
MKLKIFSKLTIWIGAMLLINPLSAQEKAQLINENVAVFYPAKFNKEKNMPSFALQQEPVVKGGLPTNWKTKVLFSEAFGKSMACVKLEPGTDLYGTGEVTGSLIRNGMTRKLWNTDNYTYIRDNGQRLYQSHPWVLGVRKDGTAFGVLADNTWKMEISLGEDIKISSFGPAFRVFVIEAENPQKVVQILGELTGKIAMPPLWSLGFQQCRWSYYPDYRAKEIADTFRLKKIPCDVIWFDIHYMDGYRVFTFSPKLFPNPKETNDYLHSKGFKSVWMIDPGVKYDSAYSVFQSGSKLDVWVKTAKGQNFTGNVWPGKCVFPDFTQAKTAAWWGELYKDYMATGIDGVWNDMNEPAVFDGIDFTMPVDNIHLGGGDIKKDVHLRYHNVYGMLMAKASREGILKANPGKRPFLLTRSNYIGGQKYAATWTGDNESSWKHLKMSIPMSITLGLSGQPFNGPDIAGFAENADPELYAHWIALAPFYPFSRAHKIEGAKNHEPWALGQKIEYVSRTAIERRYRLLPYIYTLFNEAAVNGMPVMRPVFFADYKDETLRTEEQAFMLGADLLVIPRWAEKPALPKGNWRSISLVGEDAKKDMYQPEIKMRPGSILPLIDVIQNTTEYSLETLTLYISLDAQNKATGKLYHDAGDGFDYQSGKFATVDFSAETSNGETVVTAKVSGNYDVKNKVVKVQLITDNGIKEAKGDLTKPIRIKN